MSKQFPAMHVKFWKISCIKFATPSSKTNRRCNHSMKMPLKPLFHTESICEHGMHGPHFVIGGQYRPVACLHFPSTTYSPTIYGTTTGPTLQSPNQRASSMSSVVALELSQPLFCIVEFETDLPE